MIGCNGGLLGAARTSRRGAAIGTWTLNEQILYQRQKAWIGDASFDSVSLLLHMDGSNSSTTFTDSSNNALTVTANGNAQISTAQSKFGGASCLLDGSGDYLTIPHNVALNLASGDFTIELWAYHVARPPSAEQQIVDKDGVVGSSFPSYQIQVTSSGTVNTLLGNGAGLSPSVTSYTHGTMSLNTWTHIAVCRTGTTIKTFLDGTQVTSTSQVTAMTDGGKSLYISRYAGGTSDFNGYIDDFRITKGVARYTASFTPPTAPFPNL